MGNPAMPIHEFVSKIIAQSGVVHLYAFGYHYPAARIEQDQFENLAPPGSELNCYIDSMRLDLYTLASRFFN